MNTVLTFPWRVVTLGCLFVLTFGGAGFTPAARATNPLILDQFTADPTARVFEGRVYVYPSHDIPHRPGKGRTNWFVMEDYHVFSSANLTDWTDHGVILNQTNVPWLERPGYDMWAPDCVAQGGKYYFYFPTGRRIGVAVAEHPAGPFIPEMQPMAGARGIDPCVFVDRDGRAYLFSSMNKIFVAPLKENMVELAAPQQVITNLPQTGLIEGPFVFERKGVYYLTYPHVHARTERLEYATSKHPLGPYQHAGVILDEAASGCWTVHHSIIEYAGQWYLFYHDNELSPDFDKNRSIRADRLFFNADGTIRKVTPTLRGVGVVAAQRPIQIDRFSAASESGVTVAFLNPAQKPAGWKISLAGTNAWVRFNEVDFGAGEVTTVRVRALAARGTQLELRTDRQDGPLLARVEVGAGATWQSVPADLEQRRPTGVHDLFVLQPQPGPVELDWVEFK